MSGAEFTGFSDPLVNSNLDVAFIGTIKGGNVNSRTKTGVWFGSTGVGGELAISHETTYRHVWRDLKAGGTLHAHLRCDRKQCPQALWGLRQPGPTGGQKLAGGECDGGS